MEIIPENIWATIWLKTNNNPIVIGKIWTEIQKAYSSKVRHYHNMEHIVQILKALTEFQSKIENIEIMQLSAFFHDMVYSSKRNDNEEQSAAMAVKKLKFLDYPDDRIKLCEQFILATKNHVNDTGFRDLDYFLDADLEKLGAPWPEYLEYTRQIRKEYHFYPDLIYIPGRRKVLEHFLNLDKIYKTEEFLQRFEKNARQNLSKELVLLKE
jgi:predicted metal-dependent HD superfamily phosphohydrolase